MNEIPYETSNWGWGTCCISWHSEGNPSWWRQSCSSSAWPQHRWGYGHGWTPETGQCFISKWNCCYDNPPTIPPSPPLITIKQHWKQFIFCYHIQHPQYVPPINLKQKSPFQWRDTFCQCSFQRGPQLGPWSLAQGCTWTWNYNKMLHMPMNKVKSKTLRTGRSPGLAGLKPPLPVEVDGGLLLESPLILIGHPDFCNSGVAWAPIYIQDRWQRKCCNTDEHIFWRPIKQRKGGWLLEESGSGCSSTWGGWIGSCGWLQYRAYRA